MQNRYEIDFKKWVWSNIRRSIRNTGESSNWYKFLNAIFRFFKEILSEIANYIYDQIFIEYASFESLKKIGREYKVYPSTGESESSFKNRLKVKKSLIASKGSISSIFLMHGISSSIEEQFAMDNIFTVGVTPLGVGKVVSGDYLTFVYKVFLPDLSSSDIERTEIKSMVDEINFGGNEPVILENRGLISTFTVGESQLGIDSYILRRNNPEIINFYKW